MQRDDLLNLLTDRQKGILARLAEGHTLKETARRLGLDYQHVSNMLSEAVKNTGARRGVQLAVWFASLDVDPSEYEERCDYCDGLFTPDTEVIRDTSLGSMFCSKEHKRLYRLRWLARMAEKVPEAIAE